MIKRSVKKKKKNQINENKVLRITESSKYLLKITYCRSKFCIKLVSKFKYKN